MWLVLLKIAIAVCACVVAITAALALPLRKEIGEASHGNFWSRLTRAGRANLVCAVATLFLVGINEFASHLETETKEETARRDRAQMQNELALAQKRLTEARVALGRTIIEVETLGRKNGYMILSLDNNLVRKAFARVSLREASGVGNALKDHLGQPITPKVGDEVRWNLECRRKLPPIDVAGEPCADIAYGRLMANSESTVLRSASGSRILFGTRSTGGGLEYRSPSEDFTCNKTTEQMREAECDLQISIWRESRWELRDREALAPAPTTKISAEDACRRYEALYGESCEDALTRGR